MKDIPRWKTTLPDNESTIRPGGVELSPGIGDGPLLISLHLLHGGKHDISAKGPFDAEELDRICTVFVEKRRAQDPHFTGARPDWCAKEHPWSLVRQARAHFDAGTWMSLDVDHQWFAALPFLVELMDCGCFAAIQCLD